MIFTEINLVLYDGKCWELRFLLRQSAMLVRLASFKNPASKFFFCCLFFPNTHCWYQWEIDNYLVLVSGQKGKFLTFFRRRGNFVCSELQFRDQLITLVLQKVPELPGKHLCRAKASCHRSRTVCETRLIFGRLCRRNAVSLSISPRLYRSAYTKNVSRIITIFEP